MRRLQALFLSVGLMVAFGLPAALAEKIPDPEALEAQSGARPVTLKVIEPHLSTPEKPVEVEYLAFPAPAALSAALGPDWATRAKTIELRALDGYVSRIDVARLTSGKAYFAFPRADRAPFAVDNLTQNEKNVALGPTISCGTTGPTRNCSPPGRATGPTRSTTCRFSTRPAPRSVRRDSIPPWGPACRTSRRIA
jgi:hypothetical protein